MKRIESRPSYRKSRPGITLFLLTTAAFGGQSALRPGEIWPNNRGQHIQAHGGAVILVRGLYYWFGEDRSQGLDPTKRYVNCKRNGASNFGAGLDGNGLSGRR